MSLDQKSIQKAMLKAGELVRNAALGEVPVASGDLKKSIIVVKYGSHGSRVGPTVDYALPVHEGSGKHGPKKKPYPIKPKRKKALAFKIAGEKTVTKSVMHPGVEADKFMDRAYESAEDDVHDLIADELGDEVADQIAQRFKDGM
ncbi:hypothetical protein KDL45_13295 [bacterium]|nr:hypothetical protein [bacterium]